MFLSLSGNQLTGFIPSDLGNLTKLKGLHISHNNFGQARYLRNWGGLIELLQLNLSSNQLTGEIPPELGNLSNLTWARIGGNEFTGCIPAAIADKLQGTAVDLPICSQ